ncbi:Uncharacterised protein [Mycobacteroides abscessus]|nr:Uncharacterised protein [Mycobacteroides abscessus]
MGPRPLATRHTRDAPASMPARAAPSASGARSHVYRRISAADPSRWEQ